MEFKERTIYVAYVAGKGFIRNKGNGQREYTDDFLKARVYNKPAHVKASLHSYEKDGAHIVPVQMLLDPEDMFRAIMGFK